jgi:tetratricopeptide (TPR) repeat protein
MVDIAFRLISSFNGLRESYGEPAIMKFAILTCALLFSTACFASDENVKPPKENREILEQAKGYFKQGDYVEAEKLYQQCLDKNPQDAYLLSNIAVIQFRQKRLDLAERNLTEAIKYAPKDAFSCKVLGLVRYLQGRYDEAFEVLVKAVEYDPSDTDAKTYLNMANLERVSLSESEKSVLRRELFEQGQKGKQPSKSSPSGDFFIPDEKIKLGVSPQTQR